MHFVPYGPLELPRAGDDRLLNFDEYNRRTMWDDFESEVDAPGLRDACGCYVFAIRAAKGARPWYIGKAERTPFKIECFTGHKMNHYNSVLSTTVKGTPILFFYARVTPQRRVWSKPSRTRHRDIDLLEDLLLGAALRRNKFLLNIQKTVLLRNMVVPGFVNSKPGAVSAAAKEVRAIVGY